MATTTSLTFRILSSFDGSGVAAARSQIAGLNDDLDRHGNILRRTTGLLGNFATGLGRAGSRIPLLAVGAVALAAALTPIGIVATGVAGGLLTMAAGATLAAAPFIGLAVTAASNAEKMGQSGQKYMKALDGVKNAWMTLAKETAPLTLTPMSTVLNGLTQAIPKLKPLIQDLAPVFQDLANATSKWLTGAGFERFLGTLRKDGVPALKNLISAGRDFTAVLGKAFRDFGPLAVDISEAIAKGASNLRKWAEGGGFQRFLDKVKENAPAVKDFFREAGQFAGRLGQILQDWGPDVLKFTTGLLDFLNNLDLDTLKDLVLTLGALRLAAGGLSALGGLASLLAALRGGGQVAGAAALTTASAALDATAAALTAAAAALTAAAGPLSAAAAALTSAAGALGAVTAGSFVTDLLRRILPGGGGGSVNFNVTITGAEEVEARLTAISDLFATIQAIAATPITFSATFNAGTIIADLTNVSTQWSNLLTQAATPARFTMIVNSLGFGLGIAFATVAWAAFVALAVATPAIFRAVLNAAALMAGIASMQAAWLGVVLLAAATPATFHATLSTGAFTAGVAAITSAWARVQALPRSIAFTVTLSPGAFVSAANQIVSAWQRVMGLPRSLTFRATLSAGAFVSAANQIVSAWQRVLAMPRSVTFTVNIVGGSAVGGIVPPTGGSINVNPGQLFVTIPPAFPSGVHPSFPFQPDGMAHGGVVHGRGGPMSDKVPMMLSSGEFVMRASAVKRLGIDFLQRLNTAGSFSGGRSGGGSVGSMGASLNIDSPMESGGGDIHLHIDGNVYVKSELEFENMLAEAMQNLKRRNRLPR